MSDEDNFSPWPFPSASAFRVTVPGKGQRMSLSGDPNFLESYLTQFGCVPVHYGSPLQRKLAKFDKDRQDWVLVDPTGTTELEKHPVVISATDKVMSVLTEYEWFLIGSNANPQLIEFEFNKDGTGSSRWADWGHNTTAPSVEDYYWTFHVNDGALSIRWEGGEDVKIPFTLTNQLRVVSSLRDGHLGFFDMILNVSSPLFPATCAKAQYLLKDYWGKPRKEQR